jgi:transposase
MPNNLPPWEAVYQQTHRWLKAGVFEAIVHDLRALLRLTEGRASEPTAAVFDSRTLRSTPETVAGLHFVAFACLMVQRAIDLFMVGP